MLEEYSPRDILYITIYMESSYNNMSVSLIIPKKTFIPEVTPLSTPSPNVDNGHAEMRSSPRLPCDDSNDIEDIEHECCFCLFSRLPDEVLETVNVDRSTTGDSTSTDVPGPSKTQNSVTNPSPSDMLPSPCGICKSYVHRHCLEECIKQTFSNSSQSISVLKRPDDTYAVCTLCTVCQNMYEYRSNQATKQCATIVEGEFKKSAHYQENSGYQIFVLMMQMAYMVLSRLQPSTQEKLILFVGRIVHAVETLDVLTIQNYIYTIIRTFSVGMYVWSGTGVILIGLSASWAVNKLWCLLYNNISAIA